MKIPYEDFNQEIDKRGDSTENICTFLFRLLLRKLINNSIRDKEMN